MSQHLQEVLRCLEICKTRENSVEPPEEGHFNTPEIMDKRLPIFLLANKTSTHEMVGMKPTSMVFRR
jgi:hypothetical protein